MSASPRPRIRPSVAIASLTAAALVAGCGGGGGGGGGEDDTYFAVQGTQSAGGLTFTACIGDMVFVDPSSPKGQQIAANLAQYYKLVGSYRSFAGEGASCRDKFPALNVLLTVNDYNNTVLPALGAPQPSPTASPTSSPTSSPTASPTASPTLAPTPSPTFAPTPAPTAAPISPRACGGTSGSGVNGLQLYGQASYSGLPGRSAATGTVTLDAGEVAFNNPNVGPSSITGSLRVSFWAVPGSYGGGTISGTIVSRYGIRFNDGTNQLRNGQSANLTPQTLSANTPARGSYCMVATLDEYAPASCPSNADGYCLVDWVQFPNSAQFQ
ncbi:MAG: hypothetical protein JNL85_17285 [Rubrivivax sp.]|nr:hypothetical protein [Rubrivivax sp.]